MLTRRQTTERLIVGFLILVLILEVSWGFSPCRDCYYGDNQQAAEKYESTLADFFAVSWCGIASIDSDAWIALATIAIAVFTWKLWDATNKLWSASLEQGRQTEAAIKEAARHASAAENLVAASETATRRQL